MPGNRLGNEGTPTCKLADDPMMEPGTILSNLVTGHIAIPC